MTPQASDKESKQQMLKKPKHPDGFQEGILKGKCWGGVGEGGSLKASDQIVHNSLVDEEIGQCQRE